MNDLIFVVLLISSLILGVFSFLKLIYTGNFIYMFFSIVNLAIIVFIVEGSNDS